MANSRFYQFLYSKVPVLTMVNGSITFGSSGAVGSFTGAGVNSVVKQTTGIYLIQLKEPFYKYIGSEWGKESGVTGGNVSDGSFTANTLYQITAVGNTAWSSIGLPSDLTAAVGQVFVASASGGSGTGTAKAVTTTGIGSVEVAQVESTMLDPSSNGSYLMIQTLNASGSLANPTSGAVLDFRIYLSNSSVSY